MKAVADSSPLVGLAKGGCFDLLQRLFDELLVPGVVEREVVVEGRGRPGSSELSAALGIWIAQEEPLEATVQSLPTRLDEGERQVIALALDQGADFVLIDDRKARSVARAHGLPYLTTADLVLLMKQRGLVPAVKPVLDRMQREGFVVSPRKYRQVLRSAGEAT
jgi:predicted nucleic acid-binding protein